jgi:hypothetical protein
MSNWDRHKLLHLADTIRQWLTYQTPSSAQRLVLVQLLEQADQGSKTIRADAQLLANIRVGMCRVCASEDIRLCAGQDNASYCDMACDESRPL